MTMQCDISPKVQIDQIEAFGILEAKVFTEYPIRVVNGNSPGPDSLPPSLQPEKES